MNALADLSAMLARRASESPRRTAFAWQGGSITYESLLRRVAGAAAELAALPQVIGLLAEDGIDWVIADLAAVVAGKTLVPIPAFFSLEQMAHLIADAGIGHVLTDSSFRIILQPTAIPCSGIPQVEADNCADATGAQRIIYTSGSTGSPKGVRLGDGQISHSVEALTAATGARPDDRHLSVLPFPMLLEQICGIYLVLRVGASSYIARETAAACAGGDSDPLLDICEAQQAATTVLVPRLLAAMVGGYANRSRRAPPSLRFVAVGGAPVPAPLLEAAWTLGIPACAGYGLSECCSVVTVSRAGSRSTTAGPPLPGVGLEIEDGEIVVSGPTVMQGYLGGADPRGRWHTGDLGRLDAEGNLIVLGRKDNLLVTAAGRNVSPEWIEAMVEQHPRIRRCVVICDREGELSAVVTPQDSSDVGEPAFTVEAAAIVAEATRRAPGYARPSTCVVTSEEVVAREGLLNGKNEPRRAEFARIFADPVIGRTGVSLSTESISA